LKKRAVLFGFLVKKPSLKTKTKVVRGTGDRSQPRVATRGMATCGKTDQKKKVEGTQTREKMSDKESTVQS